RGAGREPADVRTHGDRRAALDFGLRAWDGHPAGDRRPVFESALADRRVAWIDAAGEGRAGIAEREDLAPLHLRAHGAGLEGLRRREARRAAPARRPQADPVFGCRFKSGRGGDDRFRRFTGARLRLAGDRIRRGESTGFKARRAHVLEGAFADLLTVW